MFVIKIIIKSTCVNNIIVTICDKSKSKSKYINNTYKYVNEENEEKISINGEKKEGYNIMKFYINYDSKHSQYIKITFFDSNSIEYNEFISIDDTNYKPKYTFDLINEFDEFYLQEQKN